MREGGCRTHIDRQGKRKTNAILLQDRPSSNQAFVGDHVNQIMQILESQTKGC